MTHRWLPTLPPRPIKPQPRTVAVVDRVRVLRPGHGQTTRAPVHIPDDLHSGTCWRAVRIRHALAWLCGSSSVPGSQPGSTPTRPRANDVIGWLYCNTGLLTWALLRLLAFAIPRSPSQVLAGAGLDLGPEVVRLDGGAGCVEWVEQDFRVELVDLLMRERVGPVNRASRPIASAPISMHRQRCWGEHGARRPWGGAGLGNP